MFSGNSIIRKMTSVNLGFYEVRFHAKINTVSAQTVVTVLFVFDDWLLVAATQTSSTARSRVANWGFGPD
ncbi:hypothetical protein JMJ77_0007254 [Colletotrichum scovillei]|uniref:Uncharacterized protein n=1 Tax=Colletotrichum scovillei TaxID=1209932 RepID=A0A9P7RC55_9PEZI|nr:hypothetical protein JMJ77_0007254 [Colletotrichum scovillei]KAG7074249.1 hypothetical protein JMJ76_0010733 [Colletotrichum scovillei]KAG7081078.1 hypothetical protein JMJ78_0003208 [Colletotrichum scovillei]